MEPFFLRCETCHARLKVRDERFLGQVQACPKCGSMVQILPPPGWSATREIAPPTIVEAEPPVRHSVAERMVAHAREHLAVWAGGTATVVVSGLAAYWLLAGDEQVAKQTRPTPTPVVAAPTEPVESSPTPPLVAATRTVTTEATHVEAPIVEAPVNEPPMAEATELPPADVSAAPSVIEPRTPPAQVTNDPPTADPIVPAAELAVEPASESPATPATTQFMKPRTLTLDPVEPGAAVAASTTNVATAGPNYPPAVETAEGSSAEQPPTANEAGVSAIAATPPHRSNVMQQLAMPIDAIDLPEMPLGEFVNLMSTMTAVPIELDVKVLGAVGLTPQTTVLVRGDSTTAGKLLARVLKEHQLTCVEENGRLIVKRAK